MIRIHKKHFSEAFNYLDKVKRCGGVALVHCALGVNRSGAICAAYMMVTSHSTLLDTIKTLKRKRHIVLSNHGFQRQLVRYARAKGLLDDINEPKDEFEREKDKIKASLNRHQEEMFPSSPLKQPYLDNDRFRVKRSDSFKEEYQRKRYLAEGYQSPSKEPTVRYSSAGRRSQVSLSSSLGSADYSSGNCSIFERYMERQRTHAYNN